VSVPDLTADELLALARARRLSSLFGVARETPAIVVHFDGGDRPDLAAELETGELSLVPAVIIGVGAGTDPVAAAVDVVGDAGDVDELAAAVVDRPVASVALALLLRHGARRSIPAGLIAESSTYSMLQAGPEFAAWRATRPAPPAVSTEPERAVRVEHEGGRTVITLSRPHRHNAVNTALSEELVEALTELLDQPDQRVLIVGAGRSFCSGGDLSEFGSFPDPAVAHAVRLSRSAGHLIALMRDRVEVQLHGACIGAGIELPAFAATVSAGPDTTISLPEVRMGLVPGAGGTVSLPRRIGRHRTALLAITGRSIDAATALAWGLVDRVEAT